MGLLPTHAPEVHAPSNDLALWRSLPRLVVSRQWRWLTLGVVVIALIMVRLGIWQLDRLAERRAHNALIRERQNAAALKLTGQPVDVEANEFRRVIIAGEFDSSHEVVLRNQSLNGMPGMHLLTPLRITNSDQWVLIDRGWVPLQLATPEERQQFAITGPVQIEGYLRKPQPRTSRFSPQDQQPAGGRLDAWFRPDVVRIAQQTPYPLMPFYIEQKAAQTTDGFPRPQPSIDLSEGSHLGYAMQWFAFTAILLGGYAALVVTKTKQDREAQTGKSEPE
jgi:surfeit locus 1 family protein